MIPDRESGPAALPGRAAQKEHYTTFRGVCTGSGRGPRHAPDPGSGHTAWSELNAHPRPHRLRRLGDAVLPGALARTAHHDEVAVAEREAQRLPATDRSEHQRTRRPEAHDRHHRVAGAAATDAVAVPGHAVPTVAVQTHAGADET